MSLLLRAVPSLEPRAKQIELGSSIAGFLVAVASVAWVLLNQAGLPPFLIPFFVVDFFLTHRFDLQFHHLLCFGALLPATLFAEDITCITPYLHAFIMMEVSTIFLCPLWFHENDVVHYPIWVFWAFKLAFIVFFFKTRLYDFLKELLSPETYTKMVSCFAGSVRQAVWQAAMGVGISGLNVYWAYKILKGLWRIVAPTIPSPLKPTEEVLVHSEPSVSASDAPAKRKAARARSSSSGHPELEER